MPQISSTVPKPTIDAINKAAKKKGVSFSEMVSYILQQWDEAGKMFSHILNKK